MAQHRVKILVILPLCLSIVLGFGTYQLFYASSLHGSEGVNNSFAFAWSPWQQKIVNGTLWVNVTWIWQTENFSLTVKVNDDDLHYLDYVGFAFDHDNNGVIDQYPSRDVNAIGFFPYNKSWSGIIGIEGISFYSTGLQKSKWHTCTFTNETGYGFKISFPKTLLKISHPTLIHLCYRDGDATPEEGRWEEFHVSIEFEV